MKTFSGKTLIGAFALVATLATPLAFAQSAGSASPQAKPPSATIQSDATATTQSDAAAATTDTSVQADTGSQDTTAAARVSATSAPAKKSWADVDMDKDGSLSKTEAGTVPALGKVFDKADGNADGSLTADEYKTYVAQVQGGASTDDDGK